MCPTRDAVRNYLKERLIYDRRPYSALLIFGRRSNLISSDTPRVVAGCSVTNGESDISRGQDNPRSCERKLMWSVRINIVKYDIFVIPTLKTINASRGINVPRRGSRRRCTGCRISHQVLVRRRTSRKRGRGNDGKKIRKERKELISVI